MRKCILLLLCVACILMSGCNGNELDFKSVLDAETNEIISLGDSRDRVEKILGTHDYYEGSKYLYANESIEIQYNNKNKITAIFVSSGADRFKFRDVGFDIAGEDILYDFMLADPTETDIHYHFYRNYDSQGQLTSGDDAKYAAGFMMYNENSDSSEAGEIFVCYIMEIGASSIDTIYALYACR